MTFEDSDRLDLEALRKAVASVAEILEEPKTTIVRDAAIQRFEYTFELCWKFLKRRLRMDADDPALDSFGRKELFRIGGENGLLRDTAAWLRYNRARNLTVHTYNPETAEEVYGVVSEFCRDAEYLLTRLEERNR